MDDRGQPDTNVVNLRRKDDPDAGRRKQLASTIFAEEDEIGTFSRGNLVPPPAANPGTDQQSAPPQDPFFDRYQQQSPNGTVPDDASAIESSRTADYFDEISSRTPAEIAATATAPAGASAMPGSARLPAELRKPAARRRGPRLAATSVRGALRRGSTIRAPVVALSLGALIAIGVVVVLQTHTGSAPLQPNSRAGTASFDRLKPALLSWVANPFAEKRPAPKRHADRSRRARTHRSSQKHPNNPTHPSKASTTGSTLVATHSTPPPATAGSATTSSSTQSDASSGTSAAPAAPSTEPSTASSTPTAPTHQHPAANSTPTTAFGASGALGPGSSPTG
jgi:hypothetical protein